MSEGASERPDDRPSDRPGQGGPQQPDDRQVAAADQDAAVAGTMFEAEVAGEDGGPATDLDEDLADGRGGKDLLEERIHGEPVLDDPPAAGHDDG